MWLYKSCYAQESWLISFYNKIGADYVVVVSNYNIPCNKIIKYLDLYEFSI